MTHVIPTPVTDHPFDVHDRPIINTPYTRPDYHWRIDPNKGIAENVLLAGRRPAAPHLPGPSLTAQQLNVTTQSAVWQRIQEIRDHVAEWTALDYPHSTSATRTLLHHWAEERHNIRPYFAQLEAIRTLIWLHEAGAQHAPEVHRRIMADLDKVNQTTNGGIFRLATKMATGTGKTLVMQMTIAWLAANHEGPGILTVLAIAPNTTVRDRLTELQSGRRRQAGHHRVDDMYAKIVPDPLLPKLNAVRVLTRNFQQFQARDTRRVIARQTFSPTARRIIESDPRRAHIAPEDAMETPQEVVQRLVPGDGPVVVLNDEAHHCYMPKRNGKNKRPRNSGTESGPAALWFNVLPALQDLGRLRHVYDFSATPAYLDTTDYGHARIFEWTISDYPLVEATEAGLVKIPRNPIADDTDQDDSRFRRLYQNTEPKTFDADGQPPELLKAALDQLCHNYEKRDSTWQFAPGTHNQGPPVLIVVAADISQAEHIYHYLAGTYDPGTDRGTISDYPMFANCEPDGTPRDHPPTLLVHSNISQDGTTTSEANRCAAAAEIHLRGHDKLTKAAKIEHVRRIFQSVGRTGELGDRIRCVVSVGMLTEGWDAKNVTHILGYRAFTSQLLCEQVIGRGLRRKLAFDAEGYLIPAMVEVFGIAFDFMPMGNPDKPHPEVPTEEVYALPERAHLAIDLPVVHRYRHHPPQQRLTLDSEQVRPYDIHEGAIPSVSTVKGFIGPQEVLRTPAVQRHAIQAKLAARVLQLFLKEQPKAEYVQNTALFRAAYRCVEDFLAHPKVSYDVDRFAHLASPRNRETLPQEILRSTNAHAEPAGYVPVFHNPSQPKIVTTAAVRFDTANPTRMLTTKSHINYAVCDSQPELQLAQCLEDNPLCAAYARNARLGFSIPWLNPTTGLWGNYLPDFIVRLSRPNGQTTGPDRFAIIEFKGQNRVNDDDTNYKRVAAEQNWCPAVNSHYATVADPAQRHHYGYVFLHDVANMAADLHVALQKIQAEPTVPQPSQHSED